MSAELDAEGKMVSWVEVLEVLVQGFLLKAFGWNGSSVFRPSGLQWSPQCSSEAADAKDPT